jgi:hypothetical protein
MPEKQQSETESSINHDGIQPHTKSYPHPAEAESLDNIESKNSIHHQAEVRLNKQTNESCDAEWSIRYLLASHPESNNE